MKWMISAILILCGTMTAQAAQDEKNGTPFFTSEELPNIANFLPAPPEFESAAFVYDQTQHLWGKLQRLNEERAQMAINDAVFGMQTIIDIYGPMFGLNITKEDTPEIYKLLQDVSCTTDSITVRARAYEHGQSRVIAGYHWQTDVDAARLAASLLYIKLQGNERFQQQMAKARQEFKEKTSGQTRINAPNTQSTATGQSLVYTLSGQPATSETRGIVIVDHKKVLKH